MARILYALAMTSVVYLSRVRVSATSAFAFDGGPPFPPPVSTRLAHGFGAYRGSGGSGRPSFAPHRPKKPKSASASCWPRAVSTMGLCARRMARTVGSHALSHPLCPRPGLKHRKASGGSGKATPAATPGVQRSDRPRADSWKSWPSDGCTSASCGSALATADVTHALGPQNRTVSWRHPSSSRASDQKYAGRLASARAPTTHTDTVPSPGAAETSAAAAVSGSASASFRVATSARASSEPSSQPRATSNCSQSSERHCGGTGRFSSLARGALRRSFAAAALAITCRPRRPWAPSIVGRHASGRAVERCVSACDIPGALRSRSSVRMNSVSGSVMAL
eukprot:scaffold20751_cov124-Isochrysis_galbana.AAC.6